MGRQRTTRSQQTGQIDRPQAIHRSVKPSASRKPEPHSLLKLQRQMGNRAVTQMLQAKMSVGKPNDAYEQEADRVADTVMRMSVPTLQSSPTQSMQSPSGEISPLVQQKAREDEELQAKGNPTTPEITPHLEGRIQAMRGGGQSLSSETQTFYESRFGYDFSGIRVHTDASASEAAGQINAQAFTLGRDIFFNTGRYEPHTASGKWLLAHELTHTIQQNPTTPLAAKQIQRQTHRPQAIATNFQPTGQPTIQRKVGGGKAPSSPAQDPAFQAVIKQTKATAKQQKQYPPATQKASEAQAAAKPPANDIGSKAAGKQVQQMDQQQPKAFDRKSFKDALLAKIAASAPKNLEEADNFKSSGKVGAMKGALTGQLSSSKQQSQGAIANTVKGTPNPSGIEAKTVQSLPPNPAGAAPTGINGAQAAPKAKTSGEISLQAGSQSLDQQMSQAEVTEAQLKKSNEPTFQSASEAKKQAQKDAVTAPQAYRQGEQSILTQAQSQATTTASSQLIGMHALRSQSQNKTTTSQQQAQREDELKRTEVANELQTIYTQTKKTAEDRLTRLDTEVNQAFDQGASAAQQTFENYVEARMRAYKNDRYDGITGAGRWLKDKFLGMPSEVNAFYQEGRQVYIKAMDAVLDRVAVLVETGLNEAKAEIAKGRKAVQSKLAQQPANLRKALQQDAAKLQSQFNQLEQTVEDKQNQLIDSLTQKYNEKLQAIDARIDEMKAANRGLVDAAMDAIGGVIKTILELKDMLLGVLGRAAAAISKIIKDPIGFLGNLVAGVKQGFMNFVSNIGAHLQKGLMGWLFGAVAEAGIQLPESFDLKGILSLVMQVLGATWAFIRARAVKMLGEKVVKALETTAEIFMILATKGIMGVWEYIQEQLSSLKDTVIEGIKSFVTDSIIKAGVTWILGLLNPVGAFIKACKAIYDVIMFFVERGSQIIALVNAVVDSVSAIADGAIGVAASAVENALSKALPVAISFLAALLGVTGISKKIQEIIKKVQAPVGKAIDWLINKAVSLVKKVGKFLGFDKEDKKSDPEHDKKVQVGLDAINQEEQKYKEESRLSKEDAEKVANSVKAKHPIFKSLNVVDGGDSWDYYYVASPGKKKKGKAKASSGKVNLSVIKGWRPSWRKSTDEELAGRVESQQFYYVRDGKLKLKKTANVNRRHKVSFEVIFKDLRGKVEGKTYQEGKDLMTKLGYEPGKATNKAIVSASKSYLRDKFNDPKNVWVGDAEENQELGRQISSLMSQLRLAQNELRSLRGKPKTEIKQKRPAINSKITKIIDQLQEKRLDAPRGKTVKAAQEFLDMLESEGEKLEAEHLDLLATLET